MAPQQDPTMRLLESGGSGLKARIEALGSRVEKHLLQKKELEELVKLQREQLKKERRKAKRYMSKIKSQRSYMAKYVEAQEAHQRALVLQAEVFADNRKFAAEEAAKKKAATRKKGAVKKVQIKEDLNEVIVFEIEEEEDEE